MILKKIITLFLIVFFLFVHVLHLLAQKQNNIWYFGTNAGLDFNVDPPKSITGNLVAPEGSAAISDPDGKLLFYSNGITVWDRNKNIMPNGAGLVGGASSTQAALIVPLPNSCSQYYLFTTEDHYTDGGLAYSVVDMCLNNGFGDIILSTKNTSVINKTTEKVTGILHANGVDIWIITHTLSTNKFQAFLLTSSGLSTTPVVSTVGSYYAPDAIIGPIRASHDGSKVVSSASFRDICEMFDFDSSTGQLTNTYDLDQLFIGQQWVYGIEFSPNDSILYLSTFYVTNYVYQVDLLTKQLTTLNSISGNYYYGALQMGPDKKIYLARNNSTFLDVIDQPNIPGIACGYHEKGQLLIAGTSSLSGLPNFAPYSFSLMPNTLVSLGNDTTLCNGDSLIINLSSSTNCPVNYLWNDGTSSNKKVIKSTGIYWVVADYPCFSFRDTIQIDAPQAPVISFNDTTICEGQKVTYNAFFAGASYLWSDQSTAPKIDIEKQGHYWVQLNSSCYSVTDSFTIDVLRQPEINFPDTSFCEGDTLTLNASFPDVAFLWSDNSTDSSLNVVKAGMYWVQLTNSCFSVKETINTTSYSFPDIALEDTILCEGFSILLDVTFPGATYLWSDQSTSPSLLINHDGSYWVEVSNGCGQTRETISVQTADCDFLIYMPNVFSPNDDGINETIKPFVSTSLSDYQFIIFDRWGDCVFISNDNQESWNGIFRNKKIPSGVFAYYLDCTSVLGIRKKLKGDITLIR